MHEIDIHFEDFIIGTLEFNKPQPPKKGESKPIRLPKDTGVNKKHLPQSGKK